MRRHLAPVLVALASAAVVALLAWGLLNGNDASGGTVGSRPPQTALPTLNGTAKRTVGDFRGRPVVVNVFASWCTPCRDEAPLLRRAARDGTTVVGVTYNDNAPDTRAFLRRYDLHYPVLRDVDESFARGLGVTGVPETFVLDPAGKIVAVRRGPIDARFLRDALGRA